jgi:hypothetical protein
MQQNSQAQVSSHENGTDCMSNSGTQTVRPWDLRSCNWERQSDTGKGIHSMGQTVIRQNSESDTRTGSLAMGQTAMQYNRQSDTGTGSFTRG